ncbi:MAG: rod shape-determining protein MreD [Acidimicrobiia bacterium]
MRLVRPFVLPAVMLVGAIVLQTTLFGRFRLWGVSPDLVMLVVILSALRLSDESVLVLGFAGGLAVDALSTGALGLRALSYTVVAYVAVRTRERADLGPLTVALWAGLLTLLGVILLVVLGNLSGQILLVGGEALRRIIFVPVLNFGLALVVAPVTSRLLGSDPLRRR